MRTCMPKCVVQDHASMHRPAMCGKRICRHTEHEACMHPATCHEPDQRYRVEQAAVFDRDIRARMEECMRAIHNCRPGRFLRRSQQVLRSVYGEAFQNAFQRQRLQPDFRGHDTRCTTDHGGQGHIPSSISQFQRTACSRRAQQDGAR